MSEIIPERLRAALAERYEIEEQLGEGGMATVYLARDLKHNRSVALKVLKPDLAAVVGAERFLGEIETTANLQHPNILPLYDSGEADSFLYYVMPHVKGETLQERLEKEKQLPVDEAVGIAVSVASALDYAHRQGVVHRDIKPANILFQDGQPVVGDFGIALAVGAGGGARLTETGLSVGTPYYMSPEQATGDMAVGPASDIYAVGCPPRPSASPCPPTSTPPSGRDWRSCRRTGSPARTTSSGPWVSRRSGTASTGAPTRRRRPDGGARPPWSWAPRRSSP